MGIDAGIDARTLTAAVAAAVAALAASAPPAAADACTTSFYAGAAPRIPEAAARGSRAVCPGAFAALASSLTRTGLWSAERLTGAQAAAAASLPRRESFHAEASLPHAERAELSDYRGSGYDRGHLTPNGDESSAPAADSTFTLANVVPQDRISNRNLWEDVEAGVRRLARRDGEVWIVTGALFRAATLRIVGGRVYVPTHLYKAVYDPSAGTAGVYLARNGPAREWEQLSLDAFAAATGIDPFPPLAGAARGVAGLPPVEPSRRRRGG